MIRRVYICDACEESCEFYMNVSEKHKKKCPSCGKMKLYQDLRGVYCAIKEVKTLAQLAEKNNKEFGKYGLEDRQQAEVNRQKEVYNKKKEKVEKAFPNAKVPEFGIKDPIPETPSNVKTAIAAETNPKKKAERTKKYILEGK